MSPQAERPIATVTLAAVAITATLTSLASVACLASRLDRSLRTPDEATALDRRSPYLKVHMKDGQLYVLSRWSIDEAVRQVTGEGERFNLARETLSSGPVTVPLDAIALFETNVVQNSPSAAALTVITGVSVAMTVICVANPKACFGSCPTFYVSDGADDVLQAEGFSSSVAPSLEARDVDALYRAQPIGRALTVTMKNEALETHVVRRIRVLAAPRQPNGRVLKTTSDEFFEASDLQPVRSCRAGEHDCLDAVRGFDGVEHFDLADQEDLARRGIVEVEIPSGDVPRGLVIAARQTLASTYLFYQSLAWLGRSASDTLAALERGDLAVRAAISRLRDAIGGIEVLADTHHRGWVRAGEVREMGPLATDVVVVPLPHDATGRVRLRLARGHWRIDQLASAVLGTRVEPVRIEPDAATGPNPLPRKQPLVTWPGDTYTYRFSLPGEEGRYELFLESQGYYLEWMRNEWLAEENLARAAQLLVDPEQLLRDLAPEFKRQEAEMESAFWGSRYARP